MKDEKKHIENIFLHPKPVKMMIALRNNNIKYATQVMKAVDCTYSHTVKMLDMFKSLGLIEFNKKGRIKYIKLTSDGEEIAHDFEGLLHKFNKIYDKTKEQKPLPKQIKK